VQQHRSSGSKERSSISGRSIDAGLSSRKLMTAVLKDRLTTENTQLSGITATLWKCGE